MRANRRIRGWRLAFLVAGVMIVGLTTSIASQDYDLLAEIEARLVPPEGTETTYGIPLSLQSLPQFVEWWYTLVPSVEGDARYVEALSSLVAPCCDDNLAYKCCCEQGGQACNIIRSGKGLAAYLITEHDFDTESIEASVLEWFRFARPDYYVAAELIALRKSPITYGLPTKGSCYRRMCETAISEGGCGGMKGLIEPAIDVTES